MKGLLDQVENGGDHEMTAPDVTIDARVDKLIGFNQQAVAGARLAMASSEGVLQKLNISGAIGGSNLSVAYSDSSAGASLLVSSDNAGSIFSFINLYTRLDGGRLSITGQRDGPDGPLVGTFELLDFNLMNEPAVSKIAASRGGAAAVNLSHAHFDRMVARFRKVDRRINIDEALLRGATTGATFNGRFDLAASRMAINGTFIPAYDFNNAIGHIPLVGLDPDRWQFRRPVRRHLPHRGPAERPASHVQPAIGRGAGDIQEDLRVPLSAGNRLRAVLVRRRAHPRAVIPAKAGIQCAGAATRPGSVIQIDGAMDPGFRRDDGGAAKPQRHSGFTSTCFLRPSDSLIAPATRFVVDTLAFSSASG